MTDFENKIYFSPSKVDYSLLVCKKVKTSYAPSIVAIIHDKNEKRDFVTEPEIVLQYTEII